jgi:hypothetical protein
MKFNLLKDTASIKEKLLSDPSGTMRMRSAGKTDSILSPDKLVAAQIMHAKLKQRQRLNANFSMLLEK